MYIPRAGLLDELQPWPLRDADLQLYEGFFQKVVVGYKTDWMETESLSEEENELLESLKKSWSCYGLYYFRIENYYLSPFSCGVPPAALEYFRSRSEDPCYKRNRIKGIDIGEVKHYKYSCLLECTEELSNHNLIQTTTTGRLFRATLEGRQVTIKKWDAFYPFRRYYTRLPAKLRNELVAFRNQDFKTHRNLPNLVGFSCEEVLAVVYDCRPIKSVHDEISSDAFEWNDRMNVAFEIGNLIQFIHSMRKSVGTINAKNMGIDKDGIVKLFEIGLNVGEDIPAVFQEPDETKWDHYLFESYGLYASGSRVASFTLKADIYAYGILLMELMSKEAFTHTKLYTVEEARKVASDGQSLIDKSLKVPKEIASALTDIIIDCLHLDPLERPEISTCLDRLRSLKIEGR